MRILADSNIFIDFWKKPDQALIDTFSTQDVVICGVIKSELIHGAKSEVDLERICDALDAFEELSFDESDWPLLGKMLYSLRKNGITVPFQDAIIAYLAIKNGVAVWTRDTHFSHMQTVLTDLQLYS